MKKLETANFEFPVEGHWDIPIMKSQKFDPEELIGFNYVLSSGREEWEKTVHFFLDDHEFLRVWNQPDRYADILMEFAGCFSPQFSTYRDLSLAVQVYNIYRNRYIGAYWQSRGISVIPSMAWSDERSFAFCFLGVKRGSRVACSTRGVARDSEAMRLFKLGYDEMVRAIDPEIIYLYGSQKRMAKKFDLGPNVIWLSDNHLHF